MIDKKEHYGKWRKVAAIGQAWMALYGPGANPTKFPVE